MSRHIAGFAVKKSDYMSFINTIKYEVLIDFPGSIHKKGELVSVYEINCMLHVTKDLKVDLRKYPDIYRRVVD